MTIKISSLHPYKWQIHQERTQENRMIHSNLNNHKNKPTTHNVCVWERENKFHMCMTNLCHENLETLKNKLRMRQRFPCSWIGRANTVKCYLLSDQKRSTDSIFPTSKLSHCSPQKPKAVIINFIWKYKRPRIHKTALNNNHHQTAGGTNSPDTVV